MHVALCQMNESQISYTTLAALDHGNIIQIVNAGQIPLTSFNFKIIFNILQIMGTLSPTSLHL